MNRGFEISQKVSLAYRKICKPLCSEVGLAQTAFDILMFLGNNPECNTARDIVEIRHIKANLVSVHVERLVEEGYLLRRPVKADRRKTELICTQRALPIIERGRLLQKTYIERLLAGMDEAARQAFASALYGIEQNIDAILEEDV